MTAALLLAFCAPGFAQERVEIGWTGEQGYFEHRTPTSDHPLQYYFSAQRKQEFLQAETDGCAVKSACDDTNVELSQGEIATPPFPKMLQIVYALKTDTDNRPYWKSILAETAPGMYREIFLLKNEGGFWKWPPSRYGVMKAGDTNVLFTNDATTSRDMWCTGEFWVSRKSGPTVIDFLPVAAAMDKAAPANSVGKTRSALDCSEKQSRVQGLRVRRLGGREVQAGGIARGAGVGCVLQRRGTLGVRIKGPGASFTPG